MSATRDLDVTPLTMLSWLEKGLDEGAVFPFCWYLALYASMAGWLERIFVMRSAFVDLVVVGIFARVQISLRSATLRDLLWKSQQRGRKEGEDGRHTVLRPLNGKRGSCARDERPWSKSVWLKLKLPRPTDQSWRMESISSFTPPIHFLLNTSHSPTLTTSSRTSIIVCAPPQAVSHLPSPPNSPSQHLQLLQSTSLDK